MTGPTVRPTLPQLAGLFLRLGLTAFGGPAAHIALMEDEVVTRRRWLTRAEFLDLSDGGVRLITKVALKPKEEAEVVLSGYGMQKPIKRIGTVCWAVPLEDGTCCVGLHFQKRIPYRDVQSLARP